MSTRNRLSLLFALLSLLFSACGSPSGVGVGAFASATPPPPTETPAPPTPTPVPMAASVNGEAITLEEFNAELARYQAAQTTLGNTVEETQARQTVLEELIRQVLLAQGAKKAGYTLEDSALQARLDALAQDLGSPEALNAWAQANGYTEESLKTALRRALAAAWMRDNIISGLPSATEQVHIRQILLYNEEVAQNYYAQLQAGADFDTLAAQVDPVTRGDIGWFPRGYLTEQSVEEAAFALSPEGYSPVIPSAVGFHILKLIERQPNRPLSPDAALTLQANAITQWLAQKSQESDIQRSTP